MTLGVFSSVAIAKRKHRALARCCMISQICDFNFLFFSSKNPFLSRFSIISSHFGCSVSSIFRISPSGMPDSFASLSKSSTLSLSCCSQYSFSSFLIIHLDQAKGTPTSIGGGRNSLPSSDGPPLHYKSALRGYKTYLVWHNLKFVARKCF